MHDSRPLPRQVVFLVNHLKRPNGIVTSVCLLAEEFRRRGSDVEIWNFWECDRSIRRNYPVFDTFPGHRLTRALPRRITASLPFRPAAALLRAVQDPVTTRRIRTRSQTWGGETLVIGAGLEAVQTAYRVGIDFPTLVSQVHLSVEALSPTQVRNVKEAACVSQAMTVLSPEDASLLRKQGVNAAYIPNPTVLLQSPAHPERSRTVVFLGRLAPEKQVDHLIRAFTQAASPAWTLRIYGDGPERGHLEQLAHRCTAKIEFGGSLQDVTPALRSAAIHVLPSRAEGLPMSVLEAASAGLPTIAYPASSGTVAAVGDGGIIVPQNDEAALATALTSLMNSSERRKQLGTQAREHSLAFSPSAIIDLWSNLWEDLRHAEPDQTT